MPRALAELSDTELQSVAQGAPPLEQFSDEQLGALAVHQGLMQEDEASNAIVAKKQRERAPEIDRLAPPADAGAIAAMRNPEDQQLAFAAADLPRTVLTRGGRIGDIAAEVVAPIAGAIAGAPGGIPGVVAGGASGGAAGNALAQARQYFRGERDTLAKGELTAATIAGGVPLGGQLLKTPLRVIATRAAQGAGIAAGSQAVGQLIDRGRLDLPSLAATGMLGGIFGGGAGAVESALTRRMVLRAIRGTPEFENFQGSDQELVAAVRAKMEENTHTEPPPAAPGERNVTGTGEAPPAEPAALTAPGENGRPAAPAPESPAAPAGPLKPITELTDAELVAASQQTAPEATEAPAAPAEAAPAPLPSFATMPRLSPSELAILQHQLDTASKARDAATQNEGTLVAPDAPKGPRLRFGARPDGVTDIIDAIHDMGGVPRAPKGATGGEWDGHSEVFRGPAKILLSKKTGGLDQYLEDLAASYPQFAQLAKDPDAFRATVLQALHDRAAAKTQAASEQATQTFMKAALDGKGRAPKEPRAGEPVPTDELNVGAKFAIKGEPFTVTAVSPDTGAVTVRDGPRFGEQTLPPGALLHPDTGTHEPVANLSPDEAWGEGAPTESPAAAAAPETPAAPPKPLAELSDAELQQVAKDSAPAPQSPQIENVPENRQAEAAVSAQLAQPARNLQGKDTGWRISHRDNGATLVSPDGRKMVRFLAKDLRSGSEALRQKALAQAWAIDNPLTPPPAAAPGELITQPLTRQAPQDSAPNAPATPILESATLAQQAADAEKVRAQAKAAAQRDAITAQAAAPLTGDSSDVGQGALFNDGADLFSGPSAESMAPGGNPGVAGSIGRSGEAPPPAESHFPPSDDPSFSHLPLQLPEMVQFFKQISGGQLPKITEKIRALHGQALGVFRYQEGVLGSGSIELRADLFRLLSVAQKRKLLNDAVAWAKAMKEAEPDLNFADSVKHRFHELVKAAEAEALKTDPRRALDTFAHEIGHFVDFLPHGTLKRGNILGRIASLHSYLKGWLGENPGITATPPTSKERAALRRQAEQELTASVKEVVETIRREVPVYREIPITAEHITSILKQAQRDEFPELYDWFAGLDRADKAAVLRQAMKGIVDERAARLAARTQTGTKIVEETITRRVAGPGGAEPTPEAIRARFDELLRAEFKRRGLISQKDVRAELESTIAWWQGVEKIPDYYKTAPELYAEMFSIFLNNPAALAKRAPTVWRSLWAYFERKPEVKAAYEQIQTDIRSGQILRDRVTTFRDALQGDEESALLKDIAGSQLDWRTIRDTARLLFDRQQGPIEARALRRLDRPESARVLEALKNYLYRMTAVEGYARELNLTVEAKLAEAGLRHDDLAEYMFHARIAGGDRQQLANPMGFSPNTSAARLKEMAADLGPARYAALEAAQQTNRAIYERRVVDLLEKADILDPKLLGLIRERTLYATFAKTREFNPLEHDTIDGLLNSSYGKDVTAQIYRQIGTLKDVRSPYLAMTQKAFALINLAYKQMAVKSVVDFMLEHEPTMIAPAKMQFNGKVWAPIIKDSAKVGTLITLQKGEVKAFYVPRHIAETMQHGAPMEGALLGLAHRVLVWPKALLTELNPGFWPVAFAKDLATIGLQLPGGLKSFKHVPAAYLAARATYTGKTNAIADAALRRLMVISRADPRGEHLGHPDEMTRTLLRMGQDPKLWDAEAAKISRVMRAWLWWKRQGATLERTVKIQGMMHLDSEEFATMPEWMKKRLVNELAGSPDFLERGRAAPIVEVFGGPIFYNAWLQGMRSFKRAAQQDPRGFWTKFLAFFGLPSLAFYAFEKGLLDFGMDKQKAEDTRDQLRSVPERDKLRGFIVPMGWADKTQGKAAYLVLPYPDQVRYLNAGFRKLAQTAGGDGAAKDLGAGSLVQFGGQDLPGQNPLISEGIKWWRYAALGENPFDAFHGRPTLQPDVFKAGGTTAAADLAKQTASNLGGGLVYKYRHDMAGDTPTDTEKFLGLPMVSNVLGRWVRVSNAGLTEEANRATAPVQSHEAAMRLVGEEMARKTIAGEPWTDTENTLSQNDAYLAQYVGDKLGRVMKNATGPEMRAFSQATSPEQKAALFQMWEKRDKERAARLKAP